MNPQTAMLSTKDRKDFWMIPFTNQSGEGRKSENKKTKKKQKKKTSGRETDLIISARELEKWEGTDVEGS